PHPPPPHLFPYTTLFRSLHVLTNAPVIDQPFPAFVSALNLGSTVVGATPPSVTIYLANAGELDLNVTSVKLVKTTAGFSITSMRSEEHTSELQSRGHLVC